MGDPIDDFLDWERLTMSLAHRLVKRYHAFRSRPADDGHGNTVIGWLRNWGKRGLSEKAATTMLNDDLQDTMISLRQRIATVGHQRLGHARGAAMLTLAMVPSLGPEKVLSWDAVWQFLAAERWEDAADALQMAGFGIAMAGTPEDRARAIGLQRTIRTGKPFGLDDEEHLVSMLH